MTASGKGATVKNDRQATQAGDHRSTAGLKAAWIPLLLVAVLVPVATTNPSILGGDVVVGTDLLLSLKALIAGLAVLVSGVGWAFDASARRAGIRWDATMWYLAGLFGLALVSAAGSLDPWRSFFGTYWFRQGILSLAMLGALVFLVVQLARDVAAVRSLSIATVLGGVVVAAYGLLQVAGLDPLYWGAPADMLSRGFATLSNPDTYGGYLVIPALLAPALALSEDRRALRLLWWAAFGLTTVAVLLSQVRGAWFGLLVGGIVLLAYAMRTKARFQTVDWRALALVVAVLVGAGVGAGESIGARVADMFSGEQSAGSGRLLLWETGVRVAGSYPLLGTGPDAFLLGYYGERSADHAIYGGYRAAADDAHNILIHAAATLGIPALILSIAFLVVLVRRSAALVFVKEEGGPGHVYAAWLAAVLAHVGYLFFGPSIITSSVILAIGVGVLIAALATEVKLPSLTPVVAAGAAVAVAGAALAGTGGAMLAAEPSYARSYSAEGAEALEQARRAVTLAPWSIEYRLREAVLVGEIAANAIAPDWEDAERQTIAAFNDLVHFSPGDYEGYVYYARALMALPSQSDEITGLAAQVSELALAVYPHGLVARETGARAYVRLEEYDKAAALLEDEWDSDASYVQPGIVYAYALLGSERADDALAVIDDLGQRFPADDEVARLVAIAGEIRGR
ncbi:MAG: O-antigen ligase family protein [Coriobacteriia bacterium]|nr:O-antigen ligase family protein [Coriobacteriia bacterium]MBN2848536.1 O-antigen ligase family protein [Coriobacteriia bacterium]